MFTFTILLLPLALAFYYIKSENKACLLLMITGVLTGSSVAAIKAFISFSHRIVPYSFSENFLFFYVREMLIPAAVLYLVFMILSRDSKEFKANAFFPLVTAFYAAFLPYVIITSPQAKSFFSIFIKPVLFLTTFWTISICIRMVFNAVKYALARIALDLVAIIVFGVIPAAAESIWIINLGDMIWISILSASICVPIVLSVVEIITKRKKYASKKKLLDILPH